MKKLASLLLLTCSLIFSAPVFADQQTTILTHKTIIGKAEVALPYIDGNMESDFEQMANKLIETKARNMLKHFGNNGDLSYTVTLNRPSLVSVILRADYDGRTIYDGANVDLTTGKEFELNDFFVNDEKLKELFNKNEQIIFTDKGILKRGQKGGAFDKFLPFDEILPLVRIGAAGRLLQIARLTENADGKILRLRAGSLFAMKLDSNPSTGYSWIIKPTEEIKGRVVKVGSSFVMPDVNDTRTGTPGTEISMYAVTQPGQYDVSVEYKRPWENFVYKSVKFKVIAD